jgi:hypothetical protein
MASISTEKTGDAGIDKTTAPSNLAALRNAEWEIDSKPGFQCLDSLEELVQRLMDNVAAMPRLNTDSSAQFSELENKEVSELLFGPAFEVEGQLMERQTRVLAERIDLLEAIEEAVRGHRLQSPTPFESDRFEENGSIE